MSWLSRIWTGLLAIAAAIGAVLTAQALGRRQGERDARQRAADAARAAAAEQRAAQAEQAAHQSEVRHATEAEVSRLPDAPDQAVGDADPDTAAGKLRHWTRD